MARQAIQRSLHVTPYEVQILAGIAMARGAIAQMDTGEGKTISGVFPAVVHGLRGRGVHVATVNRYLAERDYRQLSDVFSRLGLSTGLSRDGEDASKKRAAYDCDITFATGYELGFDFLRDRIALSAYRNERLGNRLQRQLFSPQGTQPAVTQRNLDVAIIDEVDSVLIDEATTPLVLSSVAAVSGNDSTGAASDVHHQARGVALALEIEQHFEICALTKALHLTPEGARKVYALFSHSSTSGLLRPVLQYVESALRAEHVMQRDVHYVIVDDKIEIVDEYTGRIFSDRNWRDGLHQAVEAKEGVPVTPERCTIARISRQRYFQKYEMLCGMTGTASGHETEWRNVYDLSIVVIPPRVAPQRLVKPTVVVLTLEEKLRRMIAETGDCHQRGQPVLIGTRTIEQSRMVSDGLTASSVPHQVLNGVQDEAEADVIARCGMAGAVTVATNLAGRGTDIKPDAEAIKAGGLHVIGFERSSSARIDRQLLGRAGRQGQPGSGRFFLCTEDELVQRFGESLEVNEIDERMIQSIQAKAERQSLQARRDVMRIEQWMDNIRKDIA